MDPNANLKAIRECICAIAQLPDSDPNRQEQLEELFTYVEALDNWLTRGGALPAAWSRAHA